jgi:hypothetical protein
LSNGSHLCKTKTGESWSFTLVTLRGEKKTEKKRKEMVRLACSAMASLLFLVPIFFLGIAIPSII